MKLLNLRSFLNHKNFTFKELDVCNKEELFKITEQLDCVIHMAAKGGVRSSILSPSDYIRNNIQGTQNILDFMLEKNCKKLLFASSSSVYGNNQKLPFNEEDLVDKPLSPYAFTKKANELQIHTYHHLYNIDAICLRFFTVYGPRQRPDLAIRKFADLISKNETIQLYGNGDSGRDYTYISDIVQGLFSAYNYVLSTSKVYEIINLGNNAPILLNDMIRVIAKHMKQDPKIEYSPMQQGDVFQTYADISKAQKLLAYQPQVSFEEGIKAFVEWHRTQQVL